jgi:hypothetical protein
VYHRALAVCLSALTFAAAGFSEDELPENRPSDWTCFVTVKNNIVGLPDEPEDGLLLLQVFVATSSSCQTGVVYVAAYPEGDCFVRPKRDPNQEERMVFTYEPRVLKVQVEPGNQAYGTIEIKSPSHGSCAFNSHIASCGTVVPPGARCETRKLDDARAGTSGSVGARFNRIP